MAKVFSTGQAPTSPSLLLKMVESNLNIAEAESLVISVIIGGKQRTFYTAMSNEKMTYHAYAVSDDLLGAVRSDEARQSSMDEG